MRINETIILLTYNYDYELCKHSSLKYLKYHCSVYLPWNLYFYEPLKKIFSKVLVYDYLKRRTEIGIKSLNEEIINLVRKEHPKYVLWTSFYYDIQESTLEAIIKDGTVVIGWFFDDEWRFDNYSKWWIPYLDYCVTNSIEAVPKYISLNARCIHTIPNTGIAINRDWSNFEEKYEVSFVGSINVAHRKQYVKKVEKRNIPIHLFGQGSGGYVSFEEMIDIFKTSKINLNFSKDNFDLSKQIKGRVFQVCMAGGFMLTEYAPGIENYFEIDKEIACFKNAEEMITKVIYYLNHETERRAIAHAGWKRATNEYTSFHMVSKVFSQIEQDLAEKGKENGLCPSPQKLKMPLWAHMIPSQYHFEWARALLEENDKQGLWKDAIELSLSNNPFNISAWYYYVVSFMPFFMHPTLFRLYAVMEKLLLALRFRLGSIQCLKKMKQTILGGSFRLEVVQ